MAVFQLKTFADIVAAIREEVGAQSTDTTLINRIKRNVNMIYAQVVSKKKWKWLDGTVDVTLPAYTSAGTASLTQNSASVVLSVPPASSKQGYFFCLDGYSEIYTINSHTAGSTTLSLHNVYTGPTNTAATYKIWTDHVALPTDCKETHRVWHDFYRKPLDNISRGEFRQMSSLAQRNEARPSVYFTGDYVDPTQFAAVASLPALLTRSSSLMTKTLVFASSLPTAIVTSVAAGEPVRWRISGAGQPSYNGDVYLSSVKTTNVANDTVTYTGIMEATESATADSGLVVQAISQEQDYNRFRQLFVYPSMSNSNLTLHVAYVKQAVPLNNDSDEPVIPYEDRDILYFGALSLVWRKLRNPEEANTNKALYTEKLDEMMGKWEDGTESASLQPSKNYLASKRNAARKRFIDESYSPMMVGGSSAGQVITGTPNKLAVFGSDGVLVASATSQAAINNLSDTTGLIQAQLNTKQSTTLTNTHILVGNASNVATDVAVSGDVALANTGALTVNSVGGSSSTLIHNAELAANAATNANTSGAIVKRDGAGAFSAGAITATAFSGPLTGNVTGNVSGTAANVTGTVAVANGGTGLSTLTANNVILGNGASNPLFVAPGASGNGLISNGTTWQSSAIAVTPTPVNAQTANYTLITTDDTVTFDATGAARTATLPTAVGVSGKVYTIKKIDSSANTVTINTTSAQTIDGRASGDIVLRIKGDYLRVQSDGANWIILTKKETQYLSATSGQKNATQSSADTYFTTGCSLTLTPGQWQLSGAFDVIQNTTGASVFMRAESGFYAADGANSASVPSSLSGLVGLQSYAGTYAVGGDTVTGSGSVMSSPLNAEIYVTSNTSVYLVMKLYYSSAGNAYFVAGLNAKRIW